MAFARQPACDLSQSDIPPLVNPAQDPGRVHFSPVARPVAANGIGSNTACSPVALVPSPMRVTLMRRV